MRPFVRGALAVALPLVLPAALGATPAQAETGKQWKLIGAESFNRPLDDRRSPWFRDPYGASTGNGVNAIFMTDDRRYATQPGTEYLMQSECGFAKGGAIVSQVDLKPELLPQEHYRFAIERRDGAYTMEMSGVFAHAGQATYRYTRPFVQDGEPIWHYNQKPGEYDGSFNGQWTWTGAGGTLVDQDVWPAGSAYPDHFIIGDPHMNFYEGNAQVDNVRLYVPKRR